MERQAAPTAVMAATRTAAPAAASSALAPSDPAGMPWRNLGMVRRREFESPDYQFVAAPFPDDEAILEGRISEMELQPGLWMHCAEVRDLQSMATRVQLGAGLRMVVALAGEIDVTIAGRRVHLRAEDPLKCPCAALVGMPHDAMFERRWLRGKWERKLSLHMTPEWLQRHLGDGPGNDAQAHASAAQVGAALPFSTEFFIRPFHPTPRAVALAEQLLQQSRRPGGVLERLRLAGLALEFIYELLASQPSADSAPPATIAGAAATDMALGAPTLRPRDQARMLRLRQHLDSELLRPAAPALTITELGRRYGLSNSALQRQFRQSFGTTVNEYRRKIRLEQAHADLEQGNSIAEAAHRAGYTSAANFATAFRRQFGISPKRVPRRA